MNAFKVLKQTLAVALVVVLGGGVATHGYEWQITGASATFYPVQSYSSGNAGLGKSLQVDSVDWHDPGPCLGRSSCTLGGSVKMDGCVWSNTAYGSGGSMSLSETGGGAGSLLFSWTGPPGTSPGASITWHLNTDGWVLTQGSPVTSQSAGYATCTASLHGGGAGVYGQGDDVVAMGQVYGTAECDKGDYSIYQDAWAGGTDPGVFDWCPYPAPEATGFYTWAEWEMSASGYWAASAGMGDFAIGGTGTGSMSLSAHTKPGEPGYSWVTGQVEADSSFSVSVSAP